MLILFTLLVIISVFKDRTVFLLMGLYLIMLFSGIFEAGQHFSTTEIINILKSPLRSLTENSGVIKNISFFGFNAGAGIAEPGVLANSFFIKLLAAFGPPSLLLFIWILLKQLKSDLVKFRKITFREMKAFHLSILLAVVSFTMLSLFGSIFESSSAVFVFWMILGMSEI
jgi:hypothetical protein